MITDQTVRHTEHKTIFVLINERQCNYKNVLDITRNTLFFWRYHILIWVSSFRGIHECDKVHIFWEGHKILRNLHQIFDWQYIGQIIGGDFAKFCSLLRIYELYHIHELLVRIRMWYLQKNKVFRVISKTLL